MIADFFKLPTETFQLMCAQALPCRALKSGCIEQKSYCFKIQKTGLLVWPTLQPIHYQNNFFLGLFISKIIWFLQTSNSSGKQVFDRYLKNCDLESMETISIKKFKLQLILHYYVRCTKQAYSYHICLSFTILFHQN